MPPLPFRHKVFAVFSAVLFIGGHAVSLAQTVPTDARTLPGLIHQYNQRPESQNPVPQPQLEKPPEPEVENAPKQDQGDSANLNQKFPVKSIELTGAKNIDQDEARKIIGQYENRDLSFNDLKALSEKLTDLYRKQGNVTSVVYIGPQKIENGHVVLQAAEGLLGTVTYDNGEAKYFKKQAILPRIDATDDGIFDINDLRRSLRRINDNPDIKIHATLAPGKGADQTDVELARTEEHQPFHVTPFWDNLGRRTIGYQRFGITSTHNNLLGFGDQALNSVSWTRRSFGTTTHYSLPVGNQGTWLGFDHSFSTLRVGKEFEPLKIVGRATIISPSITQEIYNSETTKVSLDFATDWMDIDTFTKGHRLSEDRIKFFRPGINWDSFDATGRTIMRHEFGLGHLSGGPFSRADADHNFFRYSGSLIRLQRLPLGSYAILRAATQLTGDHLVSAEQYQLGGAFTVRGYPEGKLVGDYGYLFSGEWRVPFYLFPASWTLPHTQYKLRDNVQLVGFGDFGGAHTNEPVSGVHQRDYALGVGTGLRVNLTRHLAGRIDFGFPVLGIRGDGHSKTMRVHFGLESNLF